MSPPSAPGIQNLAPAFLPASLMCSEVRAPGANLTARECRSLRSLQGPLYSCRGVDHPMEGSRRRGTHQKETGQQPEGRKATRWLLHLLMLPLHSSPAAWRAHVLCASCSQGDAELVQAALVHSERVCEPETTVSQLWVAWECAVQGRRGHAKRELGVRGRHP